MEPEVATAGVEIHKSRRCVNCFLCKTKLGKVYCSQMLWENHGFRRSYLWGSGDKTFPKRYYQLPVNEVAMSCKYYEEGR